MLLFSSRPEIGVILSPGQNPAEFILIAAKAAAAAAAASATSRFEEFSAEISANCAPRNTVLDSRANSTAAALESNAVGDVEYLYEDAETETGASEGAGREMGLGGSEHVVEQESELGVGRGVLLLKEEGSPTRDMLRALRGQRTPYAVGFWAQVIFVVCYTCYGCWYGCGCCFVVAVDVGDAVVFDAGSGLWCAVCCCCVPGILCLWRVLSSVFLI